MFLVVLIFGIAAWFASTALLMVLFGAVHSFWPAIPAFSFWQTLLVGLLVSVLTGGIGRAAR